MTKPYEFAEQLNKKDLKDVTNPDDAIASAFLFKNI